MGKQIKGEREEEERKGEREGRGGREKWEGRKRERIKKEMGQNQGEKQR